MKLPSVICVSALLLIGPSLLAAPETALFGDPIVAKGKGFEIHQSELDEVTTGFRATAAGRGQKVPDAEMAQVAKEMLQRLIQIQLLNLRATDKEKQSGTELGTQRFEDFKKKSISDEVFTSKLKSLGSSPEELKARLIQEAIGELVLNRELRSKVNVTDADVKKFYDDNPGYFEQPEKVKIQHILLSTRSANGVELSDAEKKAKYDKLEEILKKARAGEDFTSLVKLYSEDSSTRDTGGELTISREGRYLEFEAAAFSLAPGQISDIVTTPFGYHIIKLIEKIPAKRLALEDVAKDVKQRLEDTEVKKLMPAYFDKLKKEYNVQVMLDTSEEDGSSTASDN